MKVGLVQLSSQEDIAANLAEAERLVRDAAGRGAELIGLPEVMHLRVAGDGVDAYLRAAEPIPGPMSKRFAALAKALNVTLLLGSIGETSRDPQRTYNTSVLITPDGEIAATYRKVHLFDVSLDADNGDRESDRYLPGDQAVIVDLSAYKAGLTICYDLRFGELFRALAIRGAKLIFVPANFTKATGQAHWITLLRARAIENGCFIVAPAQCGRFSDGFEAYGHSTIIDPWGSVLVEHDDTPGVSVTAIDLSKADEVRRAIPVLQHLRPDVYRNTR
ncbi:MAG: carbon-nitrogen hydrolase family protein [Planctomycetota bacterium]